MSKRKRVNEQEDSYQQLKTHVGLKEISYNSATHMSAVYGMVYSSILYMWAGHCKRYRATGPHRAGVDMDVTPPTGGPVGHPPNPATLCDRSVQGSKL